MKITDLSKEQIENIVAALFSNGRSPLALIDLESGQLEILERRIDDYKKASWQPNNDNLLYNLCHWRDCANLTRDQASVIHVSHLNSIIAALESAQVVPDELTDDDLEAELKARWADSFRGGWNACRAAMLNQASIKQPTPDECRAALTLALQAMEFMGNALNELDAASPEDVAAVTPAFDAVRAVLGSTTKPAPALALTPKNGELSSAPPGWKLVPIDPTPEMIAAALNSDDASFDNIDGEEIVYVHHDAIYEAMINAAPQQEGENQ